MAFRKFETTGRFIKIIALNKFSKIYVRSSFRENIFLSSSLSSLLHIHVFFWDYHVFLNHPPSSLSLSILQAASRTHRCIGVSCCDCSRCRLAGRLWSSVLWRTADSHCCRSRSPVCRQSNQQQAHLRSLAHWARRMTQLEVARGPLSAHVYAEQKTCVR